MWNMIPKTDTVNGVVRFTAALHPVGRLVEPIELTFESGVVTSVRGGWQARAWERWLRSFGDADVFEFSHLSGGLAATARVIGHDWEDLIMRGSIVAAGEPLGAREPCGTLDAGSHSGLYARYTKQGGA
jgi:hypothetical protein